VLSVAAKNKLWMGVAEIFFIIYFYITMCHVILPNNA